MKKSSASQHTGQLWWTLVNAVVYHLHISKIYNKNVKSTYI